MSANDRQRVTEQRRNTQGRGGQIVFRDHGPALYRDGQEKFLRDPFDKVPLGTQFRFR